MSDPGTEEVLKSLAALKLASDANAEEVLRNLAALEIAVLKRLNALASRAQRIEEKLDRVLVVLHRIDREVPTEEPKAR